MCIFSSREPTIVSWVSWALGSHMIYRPTYRRLIHIEWKHLKTSFVVLPVSDCSVCKTSVWSTKIRMLWPRAQAVCTVNRERKPRRASRGQGRTFHYKGAVFCLKLCGWGLPLRIGCNLIMHQVRLQRTKCGECTWHLAFGEESHSCLLTMNEEQRWGPCFQSLLGSFGTDPASCMLSFA